MKRSNVRINDIAFYSSKYLILIFLLLLVTLPFIYAFAVSIRPAQEVLTTKAHLIPHTVTFEKWTTALNDLSEPLMNSFLIASGTAIISLLITIPGAYAFGRVDFPGKRGLFYLIIVALMFPYVLLIIPILDAWYMLNLYNTIPGMWIAYQVFVTPWAIWILRDFFEKLPANLEEAARVYGCTKFTAFVRVILPLSMPAIAAVAFLSFLTGWNDFLFSSMLTSGLGPRPAVVWLFISTTAGETFDWPLIMAQTLMVGIPPTVLYMFTRRYLTKSFAL